MAPQPKAPPDQATSVPPRRVPLQGGGTRRRGSPEPRPSPNSTATKSEPFRSSDKCAAKEGPPARAGNQTEGNLRPVSDKSPHS